MARRTTQSKKVASLLASMETKLWCQCFTSIPPRERRAAQYVLQGYMANPSLQLQRSKDDFLAPFWLLMKPLAKPEQLEHALEVLSRNGLDDFSVPDDCLNVLHFEDGIRTLTPANRTLASYVLLSPPTSLYQKLLETDDGEPTHPTLAALSQCLRLTMAEKRVLDFLEKRDIPGMRAMLRQCGTASGRINLQRIAGFLGLSYEELSLALRPSGPLRALDLLVLDMSQSDLEDALASSHFLDTLVASAAADEADLLNTLIEPAPLGELELDDYPHLAKEAERLALCMKAAATRGEEGVNALFYGPPGSGKTEFAKALAKTIGLRAYLVQTDDGSGKNGLGRNERLSAYRLAQRLLANQRDALVIFDEIEDVFNGYGTQVLALFEDPQHQSMLQKGSMNRILEENPVPTIWISNSIDALDSAYRRRFLLPVEFCTPPKLVRRQIAEKLLGGLGLPDALLDELAADEKLMPAQLATARKLFSLSESNPMDRCAVEMIRDGLSAQRRLLYGRGSSTASTTGMAFDLSFLNLTGGIEPAKLISALKQKRFGRLCFYGLPGTGKSALARVLADQLKLELVDRKASDLISCYVGETETNLARLFHDHDPERTLILLDEADGFLRDRRRALHRWETAQVNELLQQMELYSGIFIATTNLVQEMDPAALRRFDFKLEFNPLTPAQRWALFAQEALTAEQDLARLAGLKARLLVLQHLTPGDVANVCRQRDLLNETLSPEDFMLRLELEHRHKEGPLALTKRRHQNTEIIPAPKQRH